MGEMADFYIERQLSEGWSPVGTGRKAARDVFCSECGSRDVHWALMTGGYRLVENRRGLHNRNEIHVCQYDDDFEVQE